MNEVNERFKLFIWESNTNSFIFNRIQQLKSQTQANWWNQVVICGSRSQPTVHFTGYNSILLPLRCAKWAIVGFQVTFHCIYFSNWWAIGHTKWMIGETKAFTCVIYYNSINLWRSRVFCYWGLGIQVRYAIVTEGYVIIIFFNNLTNINSLCTGFLWFRCTSVARIVRIPLF